MTAATVAPATSPADAARAWSGEAPWCPYCGLDAELSDGARMIPHAPHRAAEPLWACVPCGAYVRCHERTGAPMGLPAKAGLRMMRREVHELHLDPLWRDAHLATHYAGRDLDEAAVRNIRRRARERVYSYLADRMDVSSEEAHVGMFDEGDCALAKAVLSGTTYDEVLAWSRPIEEARRIVRGHERDVAWARRREEAARDGGRALDGTAAGTGA